MPRYAFTPRVVDSTGREATRPQELVVLSHEYRDEVLADSPYCWWRLAEAAGTVADNAGSTGADGTYAEASAGGYLLGQESLCDGIDDFAVALVRAKGGHVHAGGSTGFRLASNFTWEAIVTPAVSGQTMAIMSHGYLGGCLRVRSDTGKLNWLRSYSVDRGQSNTPLVPGARHHVAVTVASNGATSFYLNGSADGSATSATDYNGGSQVFKIGCDTSSSGVKSDFWEGVVDEAAIYNQALSAARILAHAQAAGLA